MGAEDRKRREFSLESKKTRIHELALRFVFTVDDTPRPAARIYVQSRRGTFHVRTSKTGGTRWSFKRHQNSGIANWIEHLGIPVSSHIIFSMSLISRLRQQDSWFQMYFSHTSLNIHFHLNLWALRAKFRSSVNMAHEKPENLRMGVNLSRSFWVYEQEKLVITNGSTRYFQASGPKILECLDNGCARKFLAYNHPSFSKNTVWRIYFNIMSRHHREVALICCLRQHWKFAILNLNYITTQLFFNWSSLVV